MVTAGHTETVLNKWIPIINPSTQHIIGDIPAATKEDVDIAVAAAKTALSRNKGADWASACRVVRARYLRVVAAKDDVAGCFEFYADLAEKLDAKQKAPVSLPMETFRSYVLKEPIGVVALITPWPEDLRIPFERYV